MTDHASTYDRHYAGPDGADDIPEHALARIEALEELVKGYYDERRAGLYMSQTAKDHRDGLDRRAAELLDLDPPGFDPATDGP